MNLLPFFKHIKENCELFSPLYTTLTFRKVRPFSPISEGSPDIIECKTLTGKVVLFNNEGKPIVFHPDGEMIYETNLGECMLFMKKGLSWEKIMEEVNEMLKNKNNDVKN